VAITHDVAEPKVSNFYITFGVKEQVFRLQVTMHHHVAVAILHSRHYLFPIASHFNTHFSLPSTHSCAGENKTHGDFVHTNNKYISHLGRRGMTQTHSVQPIYGSAKVL
jgi:hypothetical protein